MNPTDLRILIVDDNAANVELLERLLAQTGYTNVLSTRNPAGVLDLCTGWNPDLVVLDLHMPVMSGFEVLAEIRHLLLEPESLPVLVLTGDVAPEACRRALSLGARDFATRPLDDAEILLRVRNLLYARHLHLRLRDHNFLLTGAVEERTAQLDEARHEALKLLAAAGEYRDDDTNHHTQRVGQLAALIADALDLGEESVATIRDAAPLHDIGKIGIPDTILLKPDRLDDDERAIMERHVDIGHSILAAASSPILRTAACIALSHHERWDGSGYGAGLAGDEIPIAARITALADVFDALTHERPYKPAWTADRALIEIRDQAGRQFDPDVVEAFLSLDAGTLTAVPAPVAG